MKITVVLYGPSQLSFGYSVLPGQSGFPHGVAFELGFHNIRNQRETWKFNVPVSRSSMTPQPSFLPMVSITEVQLYPTCAMLHHERRNLMWFTVTSKHGHMLNLREFRVNSNLFRKMIITGVEIKGSP